MGAGSLPGYVVELLHLLGIDSSRLILPKSRLAESPLTLSHTCLASAHDLVVIHSQTCTLCPFLFSCWYNETHKFVTCPPIHYFHAHVSWQAHRRRMRENSHHPRAGRLHWAIPLATAHPTELSSAKHRHFAGALLPYWQNG
jgi:hypothetical protein